MIRTMIQYKLHTLMIQYKLFLTLYSVSTHSHREQHPLADVALA